MAEAFTNAFVRVKVLEIRAQMEECLNCTCTRSGAVCEILQGDGFPECMPPPGLPSQQNRHDDVMGGKSRH